MDKQTKHRLEALERNIEMLIGAIKQNRQMIINQHHRFIALHEDKSKEAATNQAEALSSA